MTDPLESIDDIREVDPRLADFLTGNGDDPPTRRETALFFAVRYLLDENARRCRNARRVLLMSGITLIVGAVLVWFQAAGWLGWAFIITGWLHASAAAHD